MMAIRPDLATVDSNTAVVGSTPAAPVAQPFTQPMTIAGQTPPPATATTTDPLKDKSVKPEAPVTIIIKPQHQ